MFTGDYKLTNEILGMTGANSTYASVWRIIKKEKLTISDKAARRRCLELTYEHMCKRAHQPPLDINNEARVRDETRKMFHSYIISL